MKRLKPGTIVKHFERELDPDMWHPDLINKYLYEVVDYAKRSEDGAELRILRPLHKKDGEDCGRLVVWTVEDFYSEVDHEKYPNVNQYFCFEEYQLEPAENEKCYLKEIEANKFSGVRFYYRDPLRNLFQEIYCDGVKDGIDLAVYRLQSIYGLPSGCGEEYFDKHMPAIKRTLVLAEKLKNKEM